MVIPGIEKLLKSPGILKGLRAGLIANAASVDRRLASSVDLLKNHPSINLAAVFGPQQGFWGETQDNMIEWQSGKYPHSGLPLWSLYGEHRKPTRKMLEGIDALVFDVQDVGTRVYTYIWTMTLAMLSCAEFGKKFVVCDRPNPINGIDVEGNVSTKEFSSFVALYPLPMRHGMTSGEIASYVNEEFDIGCDLTVIKMDGWKRSMWFDDTGLPWVMPSANVPTLDTAVVYPGTVIFEGTEISEGRGTTRPFEFVGAPFIDGFELADALEKYEPAGVVFRPCVFIPTFNKHAGKNCGGLQLHVTDRAAFRPVKTAIAILKTIRDMCPEKFEWKKPPYEYEYARLPIDVIFGADWVRRAMETRGEIRRSSLVARRSKIPKQEAGGMKQEKSEGQISAIIARLDDEAAKFAATRKKYLLY